MTIVFPFGRLAEDTASTPVNGFEAPTREKYTMSVFPPTLAAGLEAPGWSAQRPPTAKENSATSRNARTSEGFIARLLSLGFGDDFVDAADRARFTTRRPSRSISFHGHRLRIPAGADSKSIEATGKRRLLSIVRRIEQNIRRNGQINPKPVHYHPADR
jgi:hypothetical protein